MMPKRHFYSKQPELVFLHRGCKSLGRWSFPALRAAVLHVDWLLEGAAGLSKSLSWACRDLHGVKCGDKPRLITLVTVFLWLLGLRVSGKLPTHINLANIFHIWSEPCLVSHSLLRWLNNQANCSTAHLKRYIYFKEAEVRQLHQMKRCGHLGWDGRFKNQ